MTPTQRSIAPLSRVTICIPGNPVPKGRPRFARVGANVRAITPGKTRKFEADARIFAARAMRGRPLLAGPLELVMDVCLLPPASWSRTRTAAALRGDIMPTKRPDLDNYLKTVLDAFDGVVWTDDAQVVTLTARKVYAPVPSMLVTVGHADGEAAR